MTAGTVVVVALLVLWAVFALRGARHKKGSCGGDCSHCAAACGSRRVQKATRANDAK